MSTDCQTISFTNNHRERESNGLCYFNTVYKQIQPITTRRVKCRSPEYNNVVTDGVGPGKTICIMLKGRYKYAIFLPYSWDCRANIDSLF